MAQRLQYRSTQHESFERPREQESVYTSEWSNDYRDDVRHRSSSYDRNVAGASTSTAATSAGGDRDDGRGLQGYSAAPYVAHYRQTQAPAPTPASVQHRYPHQTQHYQQKQQNKRKQHTQRKQYYSHDTYRRGGGDGGGTDTEETRRDWTHEKPRYGYKTVGTIKIDTFGNNREASRDHSRDHSHGGGGGGGGDDDDNNGDNITRKWQEWKDREEREEKEEREKQKKREDEEEEERDRQERVERVERRTGSGHFQPYGRPDKMPAGFEQPDVLPNRFKMRQFMVSTENGSVLRFPVESSVKIGDCFSTLCMSQLTHDDALECKATGEVYVRLSAVENSLREVGTVYDNFRSMKREVIVAQRKKRQQQVDAAFEVMTSYIRRRIPPQMTPEPVPEVAPAPKQSLSLDDQFRQEEEEELRLFDECE